MVIKTKARAKKKDKTRAELIKEIMGKVKSVRNTQVKAMFRQELNRSNKTRLKYINKRVRVEQDKTGVDIRTD